MSDQPENHIWFGFTSAGWTCRYWGWSGWLPTSIQWVRTCITAPYT